MRPGTKQQLRDISPTLQEMESKVNDMVRSRGSVVRRTGGAAASDATHLHNNNILPGDSSSTNSSSPKSSSKLHNSKSIRQRRLLSTISLGTILAVMMWWRRGFDHISYDSDRPVKTSISSTAFNNNNNPPAKATVAYAVSFIECTDHHKSGQSSIAGLIDASLILRHSIHMNSIRNYPASGSHYDYQMYALIHKTKAASCAPALEKAGFTILLVEPPISQSEIQGDYLRKTIKREVCCGADEFIKLYAYTHMKQHPLVVHLDIDFLFRQPLDDVFDAMLEKDDESSLSAAKARIEREDPSDPWPSNIEAAITRDYHSSFGMGRKSGFQAGFWVLKPSQAHFDKLVDIIREGNYTEGFGRDNGWGGLGYGGFVGAMAMQGLIAYYYDVFVPGTWLELNNCRHNAVSAIVVKKGACKSGKAYCEDCRYTAVQNLTSIHYTACRKPWTCIATKSTENKHNRKNTIPVDIVDYNACMERQAVWHNMRIDLETQLFRLTEDARVPSGQKGSYNREFFGGHCTEDQSKGYLQMAGGAEELLQRIPELYGGNIATK